MGNLPEIKSIYLKMRLDDSSNPREHAIVYAWEICTTIVENYIIAKYYSKLPRFSLCLKVGLF